MERSSARGASGGRKWAVELCDSAPSSSIRDVPDPLGYSRTSLELEESAPGKAKKEIDANFKQAKAWETAQAPFKNLFMIGFMMWMAGNTVHLFSIGITFSALWQPISALQAVNKTFEPFKDARTDTLLPKLLFIAMNFAGLGLGLWKLNSLGLLPTHASDWVSTLAPPTNVEFSGGGVPLS
ncbi:ER membrane protein complex subunit 4 [Marchantia polymorpha subsp. ruderalis]|uniref:ER membrane protein complex subunit 4 n=2 Tax=Marchantia polymorpha TaxID=3197 RepID=A0AAF6B1Z4_MARPO|nr:hypothetical protein MARPO_0039s0015 [Marchantia polymorpha]BBN06028.1 hypothetical protein Mp_3g17810 [Marchantia polymorpha subsp. ruderalis]|eukprot:PTQ40500.1 hypothetical protein MARPO_0039s0015 [Marchantia polymorpha]